MKTADDTDLMIRSLAGEAGAGQRRPALSFERILLLATILSLICAIVLVFVTFGFQPELQATLRSAPFHHKIISMLMLAGGGILAVRHAGKPGSGSFRLPCCCRGWRCC
nr:NrsF family protein [Rhizobium lusitanum]